MPDSEIEVLNDPAINDAVTFINGKVEQTVYEGAIEIGKYVLEHFFDNNIENVSSKNPLKPVSFRKLCTHPDLTVSHVALGNMVRVAAQERFLKDND